MKNLEKKTTTVNFSVRLISGLMSITEISLKEMIIIIRKASWWPQGHYDPSNTYNMDSVTLYRIKKTAWLNIK